METLLGLIQDFFFIIALAVLLVISFLVVVFSFSTLVDISKSKISKARYEIIALIVFSSCLLIGLQGFIRTISSELDLYDSLIPLCKGLAFVFGISVGCSPGVEIEKKEPRDSSENTKKERKD